jgi:hypothetical protein
MPHWGVKGSVARERYAIEEMTEARLIALNLSGGME